MRDTYLSFIAGTVYKPHPAIQISESPESAEHVLFLFRNIVDVSLKKLGVELWSNKFEDRVGEDRRRSTLSRSVFGMDTARCRRSVVVSEKDVLGVKWGVSSMMVLGVVLDGCLRTRFVNARNPDFKKSEYLRKGFRRCMIGR